MSNICYVCEVDEAVLSLNLLIKYEKIKGGDKEDEKNLPQTVKISHAQS